MGLPNGRNATEYSLTVSYTFHTCLVYPLIYQEKYIVSLQASDRKKHASSIHTSSAEKLEPPEHSSTVAEMSKLRYIPTLEHSPAMRGSKLLMPTKTWINI